MDSHHIVHAFVRDEIYHLHSIQFTVVGCFSIYCENQYKHVVTRTINSRNKQMTLRKATRMRAMTIAIVAIE